MIRYIFLCIVLIVLFMIRNKRHHFYGSMVVEPKELKKGLMFRKQELNNKEGLLFKMNTNSNNNSVWMKNTYISLDVIFLNNNMKVVDYVENLTPLSTKSIQSDKPSTYILEMNSGTIKNYSVNIDDTILFTLTDELS